MYPENVIYKRRATSQKYCTACKEFLSGDGSLISPHKCGCGGYIWDWTTNKYRLEVKV